MLSSTGAILVLGMNYPPEPTGISPYTGALSRGLVERGFTVRVLTTHPHYPEWRVRSGYGQWSRTECLDGVDVTRLRHFVPNPPKGIRRLLSEASFGVRLFFGRWGRPEAIVLVSPALISSLIAAVRAKLLLRRVPLVVWVQDIYTLGLAETNQAGRLVVKAMAHLEGWVLRRADTVVVIHDRFAARISREFGVSRDRIQVIRNWAHLSPAPNVDVREARARLDWMEDEIVVLHAGNMGLKQGLGSVVEASRLAEERGLHVKFVLLGSGSELAALRAQGAGISALQFLAPLEDDDFAAALAGADCLLVNESPGISEMAVPSKLTSYFSAGRPVIAATSETGTTAEEIRAADAGVIVPPGNPEALLMAVTALVDDSIRSEQLGANGRQYRFEKLTEEAAIDSFAELLTRLNLDVASSGEFDK